MVSLYVDCFIHVFKTDVRMRMIELRMILHLAKEDLSAESFSICTRYPDIVDTISRLPAILAVDANLKNFQFFSEADSDFSGMPALILFNNFVNEKYIISRPIAIMMKEQS